jgi:hypothetical protein
VVWLGTRHLQQSLAVPRSATVISSLTFESDHPLMRSNTRECPQYQLCLALVHYRFIYKHALIMPQLHELPTEVLIHILASSNCLSDLGALASTSQRLYSVFQSDQTALIYRALASELGQDVLADALGLSHVQVPEETSGDVRECRDQFQGALSAYTGYLEGGYDDNRPSPRRLSLDYVLRLIRTFRAVAFVADLYITCALGLFEREVRPALPAGAADSVATSLLAPPSHVEWLRVVRACYRLPIVLGLWLGRGWEEPGCHPESDWLNYALFGLWEMWEVHQVICVGTFYNRFRRVLAEVVYLGDEDSPQRKFLTRRSLPFDEFWDLVAQVRAVDEGAWQETLDRASSFPSGVESAGTDERRALVWFQDRLYDHSRWSGPPERHRVPRSLSFHGDYINTAPLGWVDTFDGHIPDDFWRLVGGRWRQGQSVGGLWSRMGFVMWDVSRVEALKLATFLTCLQTYSARPPG